MHHHPIILLRWAFLCCFLPFGVTLAQSEPLSAEIATSINALGLDLYRQQIKTAGPNDILLSPYSVASSLAMVYLGADGITRSEMQRVLHLPDDGHDAGAGFASLSRQLTKLVRSSAYRAAAMQDEGNIASPVRLEVANGIFLQPGCTLRPAFTAQLQEQFESTIMPLDFQNDSAHARRVINQWVATQTHDHIQNILPPGQPDAGTVLALVNALFFRAAWEHDYDFEKSLTHSALFHLADGTTVSVPTMQAHHTYRCAKRDGYTVVTIPYFDRGLQFVLIVPDAIDGLASVESTLTAQTLRGFRHLAFNDVTLHLPKFTINPPAMPLGPALQALGMKSAFDHTAGSANFDRMAARQPGANLSIGAVFHKTHLVLDEEGTEAAAATAVTMHTLGIMGPAKSPPLEIRADRPFLFAIQHVESGVCLFLGRVTDPRSRVAN